jgi:hypothetical protein
MIPVRSTPASRLREAHGNACRVARCFGERRQVGKDHAAKKLERDENSKKVILL